MSSSFAPSENFRKSDNYPDRGGTRTADELVYLFGLARAKYYRPTEKLQSQLEPLSDSFDYLIDA